MKITPQSFWRNTKKIVLFGLSRNPSSVSHSVFHLLQSKGYQVFPVNPNVTEIGKIKCFQNLAQIPGQPEAAVIITNPSISAGIVRECAARNIRLLWFQLHTIDEAVRRLCAENEIEYINDCLLVQPDVL